MRSAIVAAFVAVAVGCGSTPVGRSGADGGIATPDGGSSADGGPTACQNDAQCPSGRVCEGGACQDACSASNPCPGGFTQVCQSGHCRQRCLSDATCPSGQICEQLVCVPAQCAENRDCPGTGVRCKEGRCQSFVPCTSDAACPASFVCREGACEELPRCLGDANCASGEICEAAHCHAVPPCAEEGDCDAAEDCIAGLCVPHVCRGDADCLEGRICTGGRCQAPASTSLVFRVVILSPGGIIRRGETVALTAMALDQRDRAVEGVSFDWSSSVPDRVAADAASGLLRGGDQAGTAEIRATARGTSITSEPVAFTNLLDLEPGRLRIALIDRVTGAPVQGAKVKVGAEVHDASGILVVADPGGPLDISAFHGSYDYLTVLGTAARDLVLPLTPRTTRDPAAGLTGEIDLRQVSTDGPVRIGLAGLSSARPLSDLDLQGLFGDTFVSEVNIPGTGSFSLPLPGGMTLAVEVIAGVAVNVKASYFTRGDAGLRAAWALGGRVDLAEVGGFFGGGGGGAGGGGGGGTAGVLRAVLPFFERFDHGALPALAIQALPLVVDGRDIDGDGDTTEKVPDWEHFRRATIAVRQRQSLRTEVVLADLPASARGASGAAMLVPGALVPGTGFIPLGLGAAFDEDGDGKVDPVVLRSAPPHSGLSVGRYALVAIAASLGGTALPTSFTARTGTWEDLPTRLELGAFLPVPEGATWTPASRTLRMPAAPGARLVRVVFFGDSGAWEVYAAAATSERTAALPAAPEGSADLAAGAAARIEAISLTGGGTLDALLSGGAVGLRDLNLAMDAFARATVAGP